jgi:hypothetical protein
LESPLVTRLADSSVGEIKSIEFDIGRRDTEEVVAHSFEILGDHGTTRFETVTNWANNNVAPNSLALDGTNCI